jgi:hypothetical protein
MGRPNTYESATKAVARASAHTKKYVRRAMKKKTGVSSSDTSKKQRQRNTQNSAFRQGGQIANMMHAILTQKGTINAAQIGGTAHTKALKICADIKERFPEDIYQIMSEVDVKDDTRNRSARIDVLVVRPSSVSDGNQRGAAMHVIEVKTSLGARGHFFATYKTKHTSRPAQVTHDPSAGIKVMPAIVSSKYEDHQRQLIFTMKTLEASLLQVGTPVEAISGEVLVCGGASAESLWTAVYPVDPALNNDAFIDRGADIDTKWVLQQTYSLRAPDVRLVDIGLLLPYLEIAVGDVEYRSPTHLCIDNSGKLHALYVYRENLNTDLIKTAVTKESLYANPIVVTVR